MFVIVTPIRRANALSLLHTIYHVIFIYNCKEMYSALINNVELIN